MSDLVNYMSMSLDGFIAGPDDGPDSGLGLGGEGLHSWLNDGDLEATSYRPRGEVDAAVFDGMMATGAVVTGRRTFDHGGRWGGDHHDGVPIFVLTRDVPDPAVQGLVHYTDDLPAAVVQAKRAAGDRDVMAHGASAFRSLLRLGLADQVMVHLVPVVLGRGRRLFGDEPDPSWSLDLVESRQGEGAVHLRYAVSYS